MGRLCLAAQKSVASAQKVVVLYFRYLIFWAEQVVFWARQALIFGQLTGALFWAPVGSTSKDHLLAPPLGGHILGARPSETLARSLGVLGQRSRGEGLAVGGSVGCSVGRSGGHAVDFRPNQARLKVDPWSVHCWPRPKQHRRRVAFGPTHGRPKGASRATQGRPNADLWTTPSRHEVAQRMWRMTSMQLIW